MAGPWEKYGSAATPSGPWEKYGAAPPAAPAEPSTLDEAKRLGSIAAEASGLTAFKDMFAGFGKTVADSIVGAPYDAESVKQMKSGAGSLIGTFANEPERMRQELIKSGDAMTRGDINEAANHLWFSLPLFGGAGAGMAEYLKRGDIKGALAFGVGSGAPFVAHTAMDAAGALPEAVETTRAAAGGAAKGAWEGAKGPTVLPIKIRGVQVAELPNVPASVAGAATGAATGAGTGALFGGHPGAITGAVTGAIGGAAVPAIRGAVRGARAALADLRTARAAEGAAAAAPPVPAEPPIAGPTDEALVHLYSVETDPAKRSALQAELINRGVMQPEAGPAAAADNPYRAYSQDALQKVYAIEPEPAKRALIEQAARDRNLTLLNREGRRATATVPETGASEARGPSLTQDEALMLRYLGSEDPLSASPEDIAVAREYVSKSPELMAKLRGGGTAAAPLVTPPTAADQAAAAQPAAQAVGTMEYNAPAAEPAPAPAAAPAEAPAPSRTPGQAYAESEGLEWGKLTAKDRQSLELIAQAKANAAAAELELKTRPAPVPQPAAVQPDAPAGQPTPATSPVAAETRAPASSQDIARQLEESMRVETLSDYLTRNKIPASMVENFGEPEWKMIADQARVQPPTAENIQDIRSNLAQYESAATQPAEVGTMAPAEAEADFQQRRATRKGPAAATEPTPAAPAAPAEPPVPEAWKGTPPAETGPAAPTASETRVEAFAEHLAQGDIPTKVLEGLPSQPKALLQLEELGRSLGIDGRPAPGEVQQIIDRVRQMRGEGEAAGAPEEPINATPEQRKQTFVDRIRDRVNELLTDEEGSSPSRRGTPMSLAELMGQSEKVLGGEQAPRELKLKPTGKGGALLTSDLGQALEKSMDKRYRLDKDTSLERRKARALESMTSDLRYALAEDDSGRGWYTDDVAEMERLLKETRPEFQDPHTMGLFKYLLGITSNGVDPELNFDAALRGWDLYKRDGKFSAYDSERPSEFGNPEGTGLTFRANSYRGAMRRLNQLVQEKGEAGAVEWLQTKHPVSELKQYYKDVPGDANQERYGSYIFGEKVGSFGSNLNGIHTELTADKWWSRTWNRWMGTMMDVDKNGNVNFDDKGNPLLQDDPRNETERNLMRETAAKVADKLGLEVDELQAVLWYTEQKLYRNYGIASESASYADAAKRRLGKVQPAENGIDRGAIEAGGPDANSGKAGRGPAGVPERISGPGSPGPRPKEVKRARQNLKDLMQPQ